jgi:hypothetical protein
MIQNRFVCTLALAGQSLDSNATLGNADLAYKFHYFDGVVLPVGLGVSLFLNGLLLVRYTALNISKLLHTELPVYVCSALQTTL